GYTFIYDHKEIDEFNNISIQVVGQDIAGTLNSLFQDKPFSYKITGKSVAILRSKRKAENEVSIKNQDHEIKGRIVNKSDHPISGVSVLLKGTAVGASTDTDGYFSIVIPSNQNPVLVFSSMGYLSHEM